MINRVTGAGVPGLRVLLNFRLATGPRSFQIKTGETQTGTSGFFRFENLPPGTYDLQASSPDYVMAGDLTRSIELAEGDRKRLEIEVAPLGQISGRILDAEGNPVPGAEIEVESPFINVVREVQITYADDGRFQITHIAPGEIRLRALPPPDAIPIETEEGRLMQVPTYYPSAVSRTDVTPIRIQPGESPTSYDIKIRSLPAYSVRGEIRDPNGRLAPGATVSLFPATSAGEALQMGSPGLTAVKPPNGFGEKAQSVTANEDGAFLFDLVPEGDWFVVATVKGDADPEDYAAWRRAHSSGSEKIRVSRGDLDRVSIQAHRPVPIDIRARELPPGVSDSFRPQLVNVIALAPDELPRASGDLQPAEGFATRVELTPGSYYFSIAAAPNSYPAEMIVNGSPATLPLTITGPTQIEVVYRPRDAALRGRVRGVEDGRRIAILLAPEENLPGMTAPLALVNRDGSYRIGNLAPGTFYALAVEGTTPRTLAQIHEHGKRVQLRAGETQDLDLDVAHFDAY